MDIEDDQIEQMYSDCFWKFIKERVGIPRVYPSVSGRQSKAKKVLTSEER